jgi:hypothetical protein
VESTGHLDKNVLETRKMDIVVLLPSSVKSGSPFKFINLGIDGPKISASKIPTLRFMPAAANAILTIILYCYSFIHPLLVQSLPAVVDLPTPPFPEATVMTFLTPLIGIFFGNPRCALGIVGAGLCLGNPYFLFPS